MWIGQDATVHDKGIQLGWLKILKLGGGLILGAGLW